MSMNIDIKLKNRLLSVLRILVFIFVILVTILIFVIRDQVKDLAGYGYGGIFILSVLANATVILPAPGILFVFALGGVLNPFWVALAAGAGAAIGELSGYLAGFSGQGMVEKVDLYQRLYTWMKNNRFWVGPLIVFLAFIPIPIMDLAGIAAGALKVPILYFFLWCFIGKLLKMLLIAYIGSFSVNHFSIN